MIIVYAAVAGQSVVRLYASAMLPGFFLAFLYLVYIVGWALVDRKVAPPIPESELHAPVPGWIDTLAREYSANLLIAVMRAALSPARVLGMDRDGMRFTYRMLIVNVGVALAPALLAAVTLGGTWWYVVVHRADTAPVAAMAPASAPAEAAQDDSEQLRPLSEADRSEQQAPAAESLQELGDPDAKLPPAPADAGPPDIFYISFWLATLLCGLLLLYYYSKLNAERFVILKLLTESVMPLGILTIVVLAVILFGITTATESAAVGAAGAFLLAWHAKSLTWQRVKEAMFLTAKTTAMVCWLFVGSALFSAVFAILGGQQLLEHWVLSFDMTPVQFMLLSQAIIFLLGWPLEWTEIIVIFVPIFLPMLTHFNIDPVLWGTLVFVNLQAAFLSPPVAMSAFYLKGVAPRHVTLNQIFAGMMPYMLIVVACMVFMYLWPGMTLWLPNYLYGN
jgi:TRAP-type mannitol/chloroaromatic compound transport system permease large subunit